MSQLKLKLFFFCRHESGFFLCFLPLLYYIDAILIVAFLKALSLVHFPFHMLPLHMLCLSQIIHNHTITHLNYAVDIVNIKR